MTQVEFPWRQQTIFYLSDACYKSTLTSKIFEPFSFGHINFRQETFGRFLSTFRLF